MPVKIGNIEIVGNAPDDLKKDGIYCIGDLDEKIKNKIPLDYEFLLVEGNNGGIFTEAIECIIKNHKPLPLLDECISKECEKNQKPPQKSTATSKETNIKENIFEWLSRIVERLPGRIIVVGNKVLTRNVWEDARGEIPGRLKRRVAWIDKFEKVTINGLKTEEGNDFEIDVDKTIEPSELKLLLYSTWLKRFFNVSDYKAILDFSGSDHDRIMLGFIRHRRFEFVYILSEKFNIDIKPDIFLIPFICDKKCLPSEQKKKWPQYLNKSKFQNIDMEKDLKRSVVVKKDYVKIVTQSAILENQLPSGEMEKFMDELGDVINNIVRKNENYLPKIYQVKIKPESDFFEFKENTGNLLVHYSRHGKLALNKIKFGLNDLDSEREYFYMESLSGNSIHFSFLYNTLIEGNLYEKASMFFRLIENGLLRILIADERISEYVEKSEEIKTMYKCSGITSIANIDQFINNIHDIGVINELKPRNNGKGDPIAPTFDAFIIHQGILDKTKLAIEKLETYIDNWKKNYFPFIIVTSGRGTPANIPRNVRFMPFSTIESNLITSSISKIILTNTLIKTLSRRVT